jgi:hypothetical protein
MLVWQEHERKLRPITAESAKGTSLQSATVPQMTKSSFDLATIDGLTIEDERSFRHVALYADLKHILKDTEYSFRILSGTSKGRWDRALLLNLTFWGATAGGDVLDGATIAADVVAHVAWHKLAADTFATQAGKSLSADALFLGEAIASAFDIYLVGRLLGHAPKSTFLETQVPAMAEAAEAAGLSEEEFDSLLQNVAENPEGAFEDLRALLFDATTSLLACSSADEGALALATFDAHRFAPLLHRYELSNWVLYARAYARDALLPDSQIRSIDSALRASEDSIDWLTRTWVAPARHRVSHRSA